MCWHHEDDTDEDSPEASIDVDKRGVLAQMPRTRNESAIKDFAEDRDAKRQVQSNCGDVENSSNGRIGSQANEVDSNAHEHT